jgi:methionyl-tRNA formyltransferase
MNRLTRFLSRRYTRAGRAPFSTRPTTDPLRILFCGSDKYSVACLEPLAQILHHDARNIESIDVLCRTDKPVGRGLKMLREGANLTPVIGVCSRFQCK